MSNLGLLILRLVLGTVVGAHGSQKMFGWFGGPGLEGTHGMAENLGMSPGKVWGTMAATSETAGGVLTGLGFLSPIGPLQVLAAMTVAISKVHITKGLWSSNGGFEFPLVNAAAATALAILGPGRYSLDGLFGIKMPRFLVPVTWVATIGMVVLALRRPEVASTVLNKATSVVSGTPTSTDGGLEIETRPRQEETERTQSHA